MSELFRQVTSEYPQDIRKVLEELKLLVLMCAKEEGVASVSEDIKWGQLSYTSPVGSPMRFGWKEEAPEDIYVFFICTTRLVESFREIFGGKLRFSGNRAIIVSVRDTLPTEVLSQCFRTALTYRKRRKLPLLGL